MLISPYHEPLILILPAVFCYIPQMHSYTLVVSSHPLARWCFLRCVLTGNTLGVTVTNNFAEPISMHFHGMSAAADRSTARMSLALVIPLKSSYTVDPNKVYHVRFINMASFAMFEVSIDTHPMGVIEVNSTHLGHECGVHWSECCTVCLSSDQHN